MNTYAVYETNSEIIGIFVKTVDKGLICWSSQDPEAVAADIAYILKNEEQRSGMYDFEFEGEEAENALAEMEASGRLLSADGEHAAPDMCQATQGDYALAILRATLEEDGAEALVLEQDSESAVCEALRVFEKLGIRLEVESCRAIIERVAVLNEDWTIFAETCEHIGSFFHIVGSVKVVEDEDGEPEALELYAPMPDVVGTFAEALASATGLDVVETGAHWAKVAIK